MTSENFVKVTVSEVRTAVPAGTGVEAGLVVLREEAEPARLLRIVVGQPEARAIHMSWSGKVAPRPLTWDLFVSAISVLGGRLERVLITGVEEGRHFFAAMELAQGEQRRRLPCRPSDGIALALRAPGAEIVADVEVLDAAAVPADDSRSEPSASPQVFQSGG